jgi:hypothetical protein
MILEEGRTRFCPVWVDHGHCMESYGWRSMTFDR